MEKRSRRKFHISFLLSTQLYTFFDGKTREVMRMNFRAVLMLCLLLFASVGAIVSVSLSTTTSSPKIATSASGRGNVQPCGGDDVDSPVAPS
jgi:hypothetical protein